MELHSSKKETGLIYIQRKNPIQRWRLSAALLNFEIFVFKALKFRLLAIKGGLDYVSAVMRVSGKNIEGGFIPGRNSRRTAG
jgi:hypothetical protein